MAYVNVKDWSVDQVTDWLKGLDSVILQYAQSFLNNGVNGHQLLSLRADDLEHLGVHMVGHQELILEAVEHLRNFHYELDKENLQMLALRLSCAANSLFKELLLFDDDCKKVETQTMSDVHNIIKCIKPLAYWLDRYPFRGDTDYLDKKLQLLELSMDMATCAHRDIFSEQPVRTIRNYCEVLAKLADYIIQEISDPMILQPATLDLTTLKKKEQGLGFFILPSYQPVHQIIGIEFGSPAHASNKIEEGDEIVQVNYQTVVGWQQKKVELLLQESSPEIVLTLKKRPRHTKVYGQIYMKPYRLPSKKRHSPYSRWNENLPSPGLLTIQDLPQIPAPREPPKITPQELEPEISSESESEPPDSPLDAGGRLYPLKPRPVLQRRHSISGATPISCRSTQAIEPYFRQLKNPNPTNHLSSYNLQRNIDEDQMILRESVSCHRLDYSQRPTTVIGDLPQKERRNPSFKNSFKKEFKEKSLVKKRVNFEDTVLKLPEEKKEQIEPSNLKASEEKSISISSLSSLSAANESIDFIDEAEDLTDRSKMKIEEKSEETGETKTLPVDVQNDAKNESDTSNTSCKDAVFADVHIHNIIKLFDTPTETKPIPTVKPKVLPRTQAQTKIPPDVPQKSDKKPVVPPRTTRGKLDKSHSTPAYDLTPENAETIKLPTMVENKVDPVPKVEESIKYELGIPMVETVNPGIVETYNKSYNETVNNTVKTDNVRDVPPKPPPRTCTLDNYKPRYPAESPKPIIDNFKRPFAYDAQTTSSIYESELETQNTETYQPSYLESVNKTLIESKGSNNVRPESIIKEEPLSLESQTYGIYDNYDNTKTKFEPKLVSTPVSKHTQQSYKNEYMEIDSPSKPNSEHKSEPKVSPTNSVVRAMIYSSKSKSGKKKNSLIAKRRKVSVSDVMPGELHGYLYERLRIKQNVTWQKRWFVLHGNCLYGFKTKDAKKAECYICLTGFTATIASEVKSKANAFKVYHTGKIVYFCADDPEMTSTWIEMISAAALHHDLNKPTDQIDFSETDDSDTEKPKVVQADKPPEPIKKFGSLKKFGSKKNSNGKPAQSGSTSLDRKWFFNKPTNTKNSVPVPTDQYRSYRKISSNINMGSVSTGNFTSHIPNFAPRLEIPTLAQSQNVSVPNLSIEPPKTPDVEKVVRKSSVPLAKPPSFIHSSNPSLCGNEFVPFHKIKQPYSENLAGFVTLEELMNRQTEERKLNPHNIEEPPIINHNLIRPDVVYGEVPIRPREKEEKTKKRHSRTASDCSEAKKEERRDSTTSSCFGKRSGSIKKVQKENESKMLTYPKSSKNHEDKVNRSLPRAHKLQDNWEQQQDVDSCKSMTNLDRSYEMIYCPQTMSDIQFAQNRSLDGRMYVDTPKKTNRILRQHSLNSADKKRINEERGYTDSLKRNDKVSDKHFVKMKLKPAMQYTPMAIITTDDKVFNPKFAFELNLDEKSSKGGKFKNLFSKPSDSKKEKSFLGSPKLHRAIFGKQHSTNDADWSNCSTQSSSLVTSNSFTAINMAVEAHPEHPIVHRVPPADYPGLEYPPVFEPETYSLADPSTSLTLFRKQQTKNCEK